MLKSMSIQKYGISRASKSTLREWLKNHYKDRSRSTSGKKVEAMKKTCVYDLSFLCRLTRIKYHIGNCKKYCTSRLEAQQQQQQQQHAHAMRARFASSFADREAESSASLALLISID